MIQENLGFSKARLGMRFGEAMVLGSRLKEKSWVPEGENNGDNLSKNNQVL